MRILCTNDDGVHAPGLAILEAVARTLSDDVWVVAPENEQSGASRALTLSDPIRVRSAGERRFAVSGTPTDCVLLAIHELIEGARPDLVLSGVNHGQNIAEDVTFSGTIAAAMQAMQMGVPAIALSQAKGFRGPDLPAPWETARAFAPGIVRRLLEIGWPGDVVMNVNFPDRPPEEVGAVQVTQQGLRDHQIVFAESRLDLRGRRYFWLGYSGKLSEPPQGTDLRAIYDGCISVTPLHLALTQEDARAAIARRLDGAPPQT